MAISIKFNAKLELNDLQNILTKRGLEPGGRVQKVVDSAVLRYCDPKVPLRTGALRNSGRTSTVVGSGVVIYGTPYARYLYYGEVYGPNIPRFVDGVLDGFWSPPKKHPTGRPLQFSGAPERGAFWFDRMKAEHKDDIVREAAAAAGGRAGR